MELLKAKTKFLLPLVAFFVGLMGVASCSSDDDDDNGGGASAGLSVDITEVIFFDAYEVQKINIKSGKPWKVTDYPAWLSISSTSGQGDGSISVSAMLNSTSQTRTGTMTIKTDDESVEIRLVQGTAIKVTPDVVKISPYGSSGTVKIEAIGDWTVENVPEWITVSAIGGSGSEELMVTAGDNIAGTKRTAEIEIRQQYGRKVFTVTQEGMEAFTVTPNEVVVLNDGIAFNYNYGSEAYGFYWNIFSSADVMNMSDEGLKAALRKNDFITSKSKDLFSYSWNRQPATEYYICTMAIDKTGNECPVVKTSVRTASLLNDRSPKTEVKNISMKYKKLECSFLMNSYAKSYRTLAYSNANPYITEIAYPDICLAWMTKKNGQYATENKNVYYNLNENTKYYFIVTWSADASGNMSDVIVRTTNMPSSAKQHAPSLLRQTDMANGNMSDMDNGNIRIAKGLDGVE